MSKNTDMNSKCKKEVVGAAHVREGRAGAAGGQAERGVREQANAQVGEASLLARMGGQADGFRADGQPARWQARGRAGMRLGPAEKPAAFTSEVKR